MNKWISKEYNEFDDFLNLYRAYLTEKTSNLPRLALKIEHFWQNLSLKKKKEYTAQMIKINVLEPKTVAILKKFGGFLSNVV